jgi:hypothetical protein
MMGYGFQDVEPKDLFRESIGGVFKVLKQNRTALLNFNLSPPFSPSFDVELSTTAVRFLAPTRMNGTGIAAKRENIPSPPHLFAHSSMQRISKFLD